MEQVNHQLADTFWNTHFPEWVDTVLTERQALDTDFWMKLQVALESSDADTVWAIVFSNLPIRFEVTGMYTRIVRTAKHVWHKQTDPIYQTKT